MANFKAARYMTRGVQHEIDFALQIIMWNMIDEAVAKGQKMDYLQVFALKPVDINGKIYQEITHRQEVPKRENKIVVKTNNAPVTEKVFVIDSEEYVTMLFAHEY